MSVTTTGGKRKATFLYFQSTSISTALCRKSQRKIENRSQETSLKKMQDREIRTVNYSQEIQMLAGLCSSTPVITTTAIHPRSL